MLKEIVLIVLTAVFVSAQNQYIRVENKLDPDAVCLDGSPAVLYYHEGTQPDKFLVYFPGGGSCAGVTMADTLENCYNRRNTQMGSSEMWPDNITGHGYLSKNSSLNDFANWTKFVFAYCDSSFHQGYRKAPISYRGVNLYFRGASITRSHFRWIMQKYPKFVEASQIIITGCSAGGIASFLWANYLRSLVHNPSAVMNIPDSAFFMTSHAYESETDYMLLSVINQYKLSNLDESTPLAECNKQFQGEQYKCYFFENVIPFLGERNFIIHSQYDFQIFRGMMGIKCMTLELDRFDYSLQKCNQNQMDYIEKYRGRFNNYVRSVYAKNMNNSYWTISCSWHAYSFDENYYDSQREKVMNQTIRQALYDFVFKKQRVALEDTSKWPNNAACSK